MKKTKLENQTEKEKSTEKSCSLCGQLYSNFAFKGGYICESCLQSIKDNEDSDNSEDS